jgi:hypothetical protein
VQHTTAWGKFISRLKVLNLPLAIDWMGVLLGTLGALLDRVWERLNSIKETREVKNRLSMGLDSIRLYKQSSEASRISGKALVDKLESLDPHKIAQEAVEILTMATRFFEDFKGVLLSIRMFGKECRALNSGDLVVLMEVARRRMPDIYEIMNYFGRNYDPKTDSLNLENLPMVLKTRGPKGVWKESDELSKEVEKKKEFVDRILKKMTVIRKQRIVIRDRGPLIKFNHSLEALTREAKRLKVTKETSAELRRQAPPWFLGVAGIVDGLGEALRGRSRPFIR